MDKTKNQVLREVTEEYLKKLDVKKTADVIEAELLDAMKFGFDMHNSVADKGQKWRIPEYLSHTQIAEIIMKKEHVKMICGTNQISRRKYMMLGIYNPVSGVYETEEDYFAKKIQEYNYNITKTEIDEVIHVLRRKAEVTFKCTDRDLIPVKNGVFNYTDKRLYDFDPKYVFTAKFPVEYDDAITLKEFINDDGTKWDVETWMKTLSDDHEVVNSMWEMLSAIVRPNVSWNCAAWLYGTGNNGKGCITSLCRSLVGTENCASIPLAVMSKDFALEPLTRVTAIVVDENDDEFIDNSANLKTIITADTLHIDIKHENPVQIQPHVFMVQSMNSMPRARAKEDGFYRRQLFIPFEKCFTGHENKRIKDEYLKDEDVLKYILHKVLNTNFYTFTETSASKAMKEEYKYFNDPVRQFYEEFITETVWNFLPLPFLYDAYKSWFAMNNPSGRLPGKQTFLSDLRNLLKELGTYEERKVHGNSTNCFDEPEYLIESYDLKAWMNPAYKGNDWKQRCKPIPRTTMNGFMKIYPKINKKDCDYYVKD